MMVMMMIWRSWEIQSNELICEDSVWLLIYYSLQSIPYIEHCQGSPWVQLVRRDRHLAATDSGAVIGCQPRILTAIHLLTARRFFKTRQLQLSPVLVLGICVWGLMVSHHSWRRITAILYKRIRRISGSILTRKSKAFTLNESVIERGRKTLTIFGLEIVVSPKRYTREDQSCHWSLKV